MKIRNTLLATAMACLMPLAANAKTIKYAHFQSADLSSPKHAAALAFKGCVEAKTEGGIEVQVYPASQLGGGPEVMEGLQLGTIQMAVVHDGPISAVYKPFAALAVPYLFDDQVMAWNIADGSFGKAMFEDMRKKTGIRVFGLADNGVRNFTNSKRALVKPGDFRGLKFRTMENPVHLASVRQLGAQAVPMSWGEVYTSLQTGVIDGQENPIAIVHAFKLSEVQKYLSLSGHFYSPAPLTMSLKKFKGLKPAWQKLFLKAALQAAAFERKVIRDNEAKQLKDLKAQVVKADP